MSEITIHKLLGDFYVRLVNQRDHDTVATLANLIDELRFYLETDLTIPMTNERSAMLYFEKQFNSSNAFASTMGARELLLSLPGFIDHVQDQPSPRREAALALVFGLKHYLVRRNIVDTQDHLVRFTMENFVHLVTKIGEPEPVVSQEPGSNAEATAQQDGAPAHKPVARATPRISKPLKR